MIMGDKKWIGFLVFKIIFNITGVALILFLSAGTINDAQPDESSSAQNFANSDDEDRGFLGQKWGCFSRNEKTGGF